MSDTPSPLLRIAPDLLGRMRRGISVIASGCSRDGQPSVMRAVGAQIGDDGDVVIYLARSQSARLLQDVADTGRIAVVFCVPATHQSVQVKARRARLREAHDGDLPILQRYLASMEDEIGQAGFPPRLLPAPCWRTGLKTWWPSTSGPIRSLTRHPAPRPAQRWPRGGHERPMQREPVSPALSELRACFEGAVPALLATAAIDGTPNVIYLSQVFAVDERHVALSFQFFNKTRENILANPQAELLVIDPHSAQFYRLQLRYLRTEEHGALFERMKAQLAGIASYWGMESVFRLRGSDIYEVLQIECLPGEPLPPALPRTGLLGALRQASERLSACTALDDLLNTTLDVLAGPLDMPHAMVLMLDAASQRLYTVASRGYPTSGVGSEIALGDGVIGVAARERTPVRIGHMTSAYLYGRAVRHSLGGDMPDADIPYPGLEAPHSQLAVPIVSAGRLLGVLFVESGQDLRFAYDDEDALLVLAAQLGACIDHMPELVDGTEPVLPATVPAPPVRGPALRVRHYPVNDSVFLDDRYLIKCVAGAILCKLLREYMTSGRTAFTNRELRLDPTLGLPDLSDNLEARLLLLQRRLQEHGPDLRMEKTGRGCFRLRVHRPLLWEPVAG